MEHPRQERDRSGANFCRSALPANRGLYYDGGWHEAKSRRHITVESPGTGESLGEIANGDVADIAAVVASAKERVSALARRSSTRTNGLPCCSDLGQRSAGRYVANP